MKLILNTESMSFQVVSPFEARLDKDGVQRKDKSGGTNLMLWAVKLIAWTGSDAETILVTVPAVSPPSLSQGDFVAVEGLEAMPWVQNGSNNLRVAYRATSILPATVAAK